MGRSPETIMPRCGGRKCGNRAPRAAFPLVTLSQAIQLRAFSPMLTDFNFCRTAIKTNKTLAYARKGGGKGLRRAVFGGESAFFRRLFL